MAAPPHVWRRETGKKKRPSSPGFLFQDDYRWKDDRKDTKGITNRLPPLKKEDMKQNVKKVINEK
jgi:hypothetical protein